jgi:hypothetical protein
VSSEEPVPRTGPHPFGDDDSFDPLTPIPIGDPAFPLIVRTYDILASEIRFVLMGAGSVTQGFDASQR